MRHQANANRVQEELESEFTSLYSVLDEMKENMMTRIKQERAGRTYELQVSAAVSAFTSPKVYVCSLATAYCFCQ